MWCGKKPHVCKLSYMSNLYFVGLTHGLAGDYGWKSFEYFFFGWCKTVSWRFRLRYIGVVGYLLWISWSSLVTLPGRRIFSNFLSEVRGVPKELKDQKELLVICRCSLSKLFRQYWYWAFQLYVHIICICTHPLVLIHILALSCLFFSFLSTYHVY